MSSQGLPILTYHALDTSGQVISTDPAWFIETIERLVDAGFMGVDLPDWIARGRPEIPHGFAITFDDGLRSLLKGVDVLVKHRIPASIFLVTNHVGGFNNWSGQPLQIARSAILDWSEIADLTHRGFTMGAHSVSHQRLDRIGPHQWSDEIRACRQRVESQINRPCRLFAYPYGASSSRLRGQVALEYDAAFGTRLALTDALSPRCDLPRLDAYYLRAPQALDRLIAGRLRTWLTYRRGLRSVRSLVHP